MYDGGHPFHPSTVKELLNKIEPDSLIEQRLNWIREMKKKIEQEVSGIREAHVEVQYIDVIRKALPRDGTLVIDNTQLGYWAEYFYPSYCPGGLMTAKGSSIIGYAFAAAIACALSCSHVDTIIMLIGALESNGLPMDTTKQSRALCNASFSQCALLVKATS